MKPDKKIVFVLLLLLVSCTPALEAMPSATSVYSGGTSGLANPVLTVPIKTPIATFLPMTLPASQSGGAAGFRDYLAVADQFLLTLTNVPTLPGSQVYQGWLIADDGAIVNTGVLPLDVNGNITLIWNSPSSENLLSRYARFQITLEPTAGSASPTGKVVFAGSLEGAALTNARLLFVKNDGEPATPLNTAFALGLLAETDMAAQHVTNAINAAAIGALPEMRGHLEHVVNILEGAGGPRFGDHDGNGTAENPGDGFGVIGYSGQIASILSGQVTVVESATSIQAQSTAIQDGCLEILKLEDIGVAMAQLSELKKLTDQFKTSLVAGLYHAAQDSVRFEVASVE